MQFLQYCLSGRLREFKNKGKVQSGNAKSGPGRARERSVTRPLITKLKSQFKRGLTELVAYESGRKDSFDGMIENRGSKDRRIIRNNWRADNSP